MHPSSGQPLPSDPRHSKSRPFVVQSLIRPPLPIAARVIQLRIRPLPELVRSDPLGEDVRILDERPEFRTLFNQIFCSARLPPSGISRRNHDYPGTIPVQAADEPCETLRVPPGRKRGQKVRIWAGHPPIGVKVEPRTIAPDE